MKIIRTITVICFAFFISNCSTQEVTNDSEAISPNQETLQTRGGDGSDFLGRGPIVETNILIEWEPRTSQGDKALSRFENSKSGYLINWKPCSSNPNLETWRVNHCGGTCKPSRDPAADDDRICCATVNATCDIRN